MVVHDHCSRGARASVHALFPHSCLAIGWLRVVTLTLTLRSAPYALTSSECYSVCALCSRQSTSCGRVALQVLCNVDGSTAASPWSAQSATAHCTICSYVV